MNQKINLFNLVMAAFLCAVLFLSYSNGEINFTSVNEPILDSIRHKPHFISIPDKKAFSFAGESLPVQLFDVKERLEREILRNTYYHSNTILVMKRSGRYFPVIEKILEEEGIPDDFKYLAIAESDLSNATSPAGAKGFWQFMKPTAKAYGLEINAEIDERLHLEKSTRAACDLIKKYKSRLGSWTMAAAAYNRGITSLKEEIELQRSNDYYDLNLNQETSRYVFRIVALKEIFNNAPEYGFLLTANDIYLPLDDFRLVEVNHAIENLGDFCNEYGISYRMLKVYNPWLLTTHLKNVERKTYEMKIPPNKF